MPRYPYDPETNSPIDTGTMHLNANKAPGPHSTLAEAGLSLLPGRLSLIRSSHRSLHANDKILNGLIPRFRDVIKELLENCSQRGIEMCPASGLRSPWGQAEIFCDDKLHTPSDICIGIDFLTRSGAPFLAECMVTAVRKSKRSIAVGTGRLALADAVTDSWARRGKEAAEHPQATYRKWSEEGIYLKQLKSSSTKALPGNSWHQWGEAVDCDPVHNRGIYGEEARRLGLTCGDRWAGLHDPRHVQLRPESSPRANGMTWPIIDAEMQKRFPTPDNLS